MDLLMSLEFRARVRQSALDAIHHSTLQAFPLKSRTQLIGMQAAPNILGVPHVLRHVSLGPPSA